ncbi:MAG: chemotaxis response regulator protein-glutamate methylesterase [candidate division Zixibacteria bacterium]
MSGKIKVLVVDDSALVRQILTQGLSLDPNIEVVGHAADPFIATNKINTLKPDVLTLDVEMPRMDGVEFLKRLMPQHPMPVVMVSALTQKGKAITLEALDAGAVDFVTKPSTDVARGLNDMLVDLREKVKTASRANVAGRLKDAPKKPKPSKKTSRALAESTDKVVAIGASTGGTEAIKNVITQFPPNMPGVVIVQHMPAGFTKMFADRLNEQCSMIVKEAEKGDKVMTGRILIAPGDFHMVVRRSGGVYIVDIKNGDKVCGHRPSVNVLFNSVAEQVGSNAVGLILTGMGSDGADAMVRMRNEGARTLAQDESTSVVFGMPREAYDRGGAERLLPIGSIPRAVINMFTEKK